MTLLIHSENKSEAHISELTHGILKAIVVELSITTLMPTCITLLVYDIYMLCLPFSQFLFSLNPPLVHCAPRTIQDYWASINNKL